MNTLKQFKLEKSLVGGYNLVAVFSNKVKKLIGTFDKKSDRNTYYYVTGELWYLVDWLYSSDTNKTVQKGFKDYYKKVYGLSLY